MAIEDLIRGMPTGDSFVTSSVDQPIEIGGPPLAPALGMFGGDDILPRQALGPAARDEHFFRPLEREDFVNTRRSFEPHRMLIGAIVILAALGVVALALLWAAAGEKTATQEAESSAPVPSSQPLTQAPAPKGSREPESSPNPSVAVAWPDLPASITVEAPEVAPAVPDENTAGRPAVSASQKPDIVFLQRPGVNIRSAPSVKAPVLGTVPKATRFTVANREGDWVQVESDRLRGWIKSQFVAPNEPR